MWKKVVGYTVVSIVAVVVAVFGWLWFRKPASRPPAEIRVAATPERIARGEYVYRLADCDGCHSPHDNSKLYLPVVEARRGAGQRLTEAGLPIPVPNITPDPETGIGAWTDGEKIRAIREGIGRDGRALFPMMPYTAYRHMSDDDVQSLVAYLNSLKPVREAQPRMEIPFPVNLMIKGAPQPVEKPVATPDSSNTLRYGDYLTTIGVCMECHTPFDKGTFDLAKRFGGGRRFDIDGFTVVSANISPDPETGIGNWTLDYYLERFHRHRNMPLESLPPVDKDRWTLMPWRGLAQISDADLTAIFAYLRSQPPVNQKVIVHPTEIAAVGK